MLHVDLLKELWTTLYVDLLKELVNVVCGLTGEL